MIACQARSRATRKERRHKNAERGKGVQESRCVLSRKTKTVENRMKSEKKNNTKNQRAVDPSMYGMNSTHQVIISFA